MSKQQLLQLIVIAVIAGLSGLSWLYRKLREQQVIKRMEDERRRREEEILRTGRDPMAAAPTAEALEERRRAQEIAARREAELQELRRRQSAAQSPQAGSGELPPGILIQIPGTRGPIVVKPIPRGRGPQPAIGSRVGDHTRVQPPLQARPPQGAPTRDPSRSGTPPQPRPARSSRTRATKRAAQQASRDASPHQADTGVRSPSPRPDDPTAGIHGIKPEAVRPPIVGRAMTAEDWRRAFVMRELLSPPLGVRDPSTQDREPF